MKEKINLQKFIEEYYEAYPSSSNISNDPSITFSDERFKDEEFCERVKKLLMSLDEFEGVEKINFIPAPVYCVDENGDPIASNIKPEYSRLTACFELMPSLSVS